ncbi:MAG: sulfurtransferase [Chloroflexi bacterium]|nr:sulfurtransferase [Chloroflexota bacterium]
MMPISELHNQNEYHTLLTTGILAIHLADPDWVVVDTRFNLQDPDWGYSEYLQSHIPGAFYAHLDHDLSSRVTSTSGRHPLPNEEVFRDKLSSWGIDATKQVVVYDDAGGAYAARLWWMLRWMGHSRVAVLDGGLPKWLREIRPVSSSDIENHSDAHFVGGMDPEMVADTGEVERIRLDPSYRLIDARAPVRFRGEQEPIDPVAGRIPGAVNRFHGDNLTPEGVFYSPAELKQQFSRLLGNVPPERAVIYCGSGVTSCHHILAMEYAGLSGARLYPGSWSEWIRDTARPRQVGSEV